MIARPMLAVLEREVQKLFRQRGRLLAAMVRPLLWLLVIGAGFGAIQGRLGDSSYQAFLVPGVLGMTLLFGGVLAALSTVYDKESGVMRMLVIAPIEHYWIVLAKTLGAAISALVQALMLLVLLALLGYLSPQVSIPLLTAGLLGTALVCASLGMLQFVVVVAHRDGHQPLVARRAIEQRLQASRRPAADGVVDGIGQCTGHQCAAGIEVARKPTQRQLVHQRQDHQGGDHQRNQQRDQEPQLQL